MFMWTDVFLVIRLNEWLAFIFCFKKLNRNTTKYRQREQNLKGNEVRK